MKKKKLMMSLFLMVSMMFVLTGCVKFNANMDIKADKSMDFSIIYAFDTSMMGDTSIVDEDGKKQLENEGFKVENYSDDKYKGISITKSYTNIDDVSKEEDVEYDLSGLLSKDAQTSNVFKVTKGFFKNTYKAKFKFTTSGSGLNNATSDDTEVEDNKTDVNSEGNIDVTTDNNFNMSNYTSNMDLKFNLTLPSDAKNHNASFNDNNRKLSWDLTSSGTQYIEFEFDMLNMNNIYICIGLGVLVVALIGACVFMVINKNKTKKEA